MSKKPVLSPAMFRPRGTEPVSLDAVKQLERLVRLFRKKVDSEASDARVLSALAETPLPPELFDALSQHTFHRVRCAVASSAYTPSSVLRKIVMEDVHLEEKVMELAAANPNLTAEDIEGMLDTEIAMRGLWLPCRLVKHPNLSESSVRKLVLYVEQAHLLEGPDFDELCRALKSSPFFPDIARELLSEAGHGEREDFDILPDEFPVRMWEALHPSWGRLIYPHRPHGS